MTEAESVETTIGNVAIDWCDVTVNGKIVGFTGLEFRVMALLLERPGRTVPNAAFTALSESETNVSQVAIYRARRKLANAGAIVQIVSVRNVGYRIEAIQ